MKQDDEKPGEGFTWFRPSGHLPSPERIAPCPPAQRLPPRRPSRVIPFVVCYVVTMGFFAAVAMRTGSDLPLWGIGLGVAGAYAFLYLRRGCPRCGARLIWRQEPVPEVIGRSRLLYDCSRCRTVWDSGEFVDAS